jgi:hypothetical protein
MKLREVEHDIDAELAVRLLGWKWLSFMSRPVSSHPLYETRQEIRCRELFSPRQLASDTWVAWLKSKDARDATGDEPLSYAYCSSSGPERPPRFHLLIEETQ